MSEPKSRRELALLATGGLVASALATSYAKAAGSRQPMMEHAKTSLMDALHFLEAADSDKGGYRVSAIRSVKEAIAQIDAGMHYDATH